MSDRAECPAQYETSIGEIWSCNLPFGHEGDHYDRTISGKFGEGYNGQMIVDGLGRRVYNGKPQLSIEYIQEKISDTVQSLQTLRSETEPEDGHPDPNSIRDCWKFAIQDLKIVLEEIREIEEVFEGLKATDDRGRIYLGPEYADRKVKVAVLEIEDK